MREKQACICGCGSFDLYMDEAFKNRITFVCQVCGCRRLITTPEVAAMKYEFSPPTVKVTEVPPPVEGLLGKE